MLRGLAITCIRKLAFLRFQPFFLVFTASLAILPSCDREPAISFAPYETPVERPCEKTEKIRGIGLGMIEDNRLPVNGYGSEQSAWAIEEIAGLGAEWVTITPYATMIDCEDTKIFPFFEFPPEKAKTMAVGAIRQAKKEGMKVFVAPHVYPWDWCWRGELRPGGGETGTQEGWDAWFASYRAYLMDMAHMAADEDADMLSIGLELKSASNRFGHRFAAMAEEIRTFFPGKLTYCANWDEAPDVAFWQHLDYIGVNAFYPMSDTGSADPEEIINVAQRIALELEELSQVYGKQVIFTEVGFKALRGALKEPWIWPEYVENPVVDNEIQALLFDITFWNLWDREWFGGLFVWRYMSDPSDYSQEPPFGYPPRLKPAEPIIQTWFECGI